MPAARLLATLLMATALAGCAVAPYSPPPPTASAVQYDEPSDQITEAPPPVPVYDQPPCPVDGYLWTPGIWQWGPAGYFWVPGTWVAPPAVGLLWTPGYWVDGSGIYTFHRGYWGPRVGFYGGINYGHGYFGTGFVGGRWVNNTFAYNVAVSNVNATVIRNTFNEPVANNTHVNEARPSYAGAPGTRTQPNSEELAAARDAHVPPTSAQIQHETQARSTPELTAARNEGHPSIAATARAQEFNGPGTSAARPDGPAYHPPTAPMAHIAQPNAIVHARDLPPIQGSATATNPASTEQAAYARQQSDLSTRQEQERAGLARQQQLEHDNFAAQPVHDQQAYENMERQHLQQTSQMVARHQQAREALARTAPHAAAPTSR